MKKETVLVIIKPDGVNKGLIGNVFKKFAETKLEVIAMRVAKCDKKMAEAHYQHLSDKPFFGEIVDYLTGKFHTQKKIVIIVYYGEDAIRKCRKIAGATNPEDADPTSIRGAFGRITTKGVYENVVHVSSDKREAKREIKLWFAPDDLHTRLYPTKWAVLRKRVWA